jgi:RNA-directed DNA polymerase
MHYAFDRWMETQFPQNPWARFADDGVIHCNSKQEAEEILQRLTKRMKACKLELHPEKTKIVYCRSDKNNGQKHDNESFDFLGYTFKTRACKTKDGRIFKSFTPAVSNDNLMKFRDKMRQLRSMHLTSSPEEFAKELNPIIRGWANYFTKYTKSHAKQKGLNYVNLMLISWARRKYKGLRRSYKRAYLFICKLGRQNPDLFYHWQIGLRPATGL